MSEKKNVIPFVKAARVGNYKVWRSKTKLSKDGDVEVVNITDLEGLWKVSIPQTSMMFATIADTYAMEDETQRDEFLTMIFGNMRAISFVNNPYIHDAFSFLMEVMHYPYLLLPEKEMEKRMKDGLKKAGMEKDAAKKHIAEMMGYRSRLYDIIYKKRDEFIAVYERQQEERHSKEEEAQKQLEEDEIAEQAVEVLNKEKSED